MIQASDLVQKFRYALSESWGYIYGKSGEKWTTAKQAELEKTTDAERANSRKYGSKWVGHTVADCSGLFVWAFRQLGGSIYHGSDTMYRQYCVNKGELNKGKRSDGGTLKAGTAVFVWNGTKYSHVGLYIGGDTVIEAMGAQNGVTTSKITATKWKYWGELKGVDYSGVQPEPAPEPSTEPEKKPTIRKGSKGEYVTLAQTLLIKRGFSCGSKGADGIFGNDTLYAVKKFQQAAGLVMDGIVGPKTWAELEKDGPVKMIYYSVIVSHLSESQAKALAAMYDHAEIEKEVG